MGTANNKQVFVNIQQLMQDYFDGLYHSNVNLLKNVFHPDARYITASSGELINLSMDKYLSIVAQRTSPASQNYTRTDKILAIELASETTAIVKASCAIEPKHFIDLLSLVKLNGQWQIISKVFHYDTNPQLINKE